MKKVSVILTTSLLMLSFVTATAQIAINTKTYRIFMIWQANIHSTNFSIFVK